VLNVTAARCAAEPTHKNTSEFPGNGNWLVLATVARHQVGRAAHRVNPMNAAMMSSKRPSNSMAKSILRHGVKLVLAISLLSTAYAGSNASPDATAVQTIVFIRHGEKPQGGFGQLDCQGLNRALALAPTIARSFGKPDAIFAPNPSYPKKDAGIFYDYVRPLATVEPTAVLFGVPVDVSLDFDDRKGLIAALEKRRARDHNVFVLVGWEHKQIAPIVRAILRAHGADAANLKEVKDWDGNDFDSMYVVAIGQLRNGTRATFEHQHEGLDGQPKTCPHN
jgi:hypothetical protein